MIWSTSSDATGMLLLGLFKAVKTGKTNHKIFPADAFIITLFALSLLIDHSLKTYSMSSTTSEQKGMILRKLF
jgi:hypothetical protein